MVLLLSGKKLERQVKAIQQMFQVNQPDYGHLLDDMMFVEGETISLDSVCPAKSRV